MRFFALCLIFSLWGGQSSLAGAVAALNKPASIDTTAIHKVYLDGDFEEAIDMIESAMRRTRNFTHAESIFIFKHLGVMYTAKYETRELGKKYMMQLLHVEPGARIMDMYASDMIYMIFKNIRDEFELSRAKLERAEIQLNGGNVAAGGSDSGRSGNSTSKASASKERSHAWVGWTAGVLAAAGGVALLVALNSGDEEPKTEENIVP
jgi:hypothetical protein